MANERGGIVAKRRREDGSELTVRLGVPSSDTQPFNSPLFRLPGESVPETIMLKRGRIVEKRAWGRTGNLDTTQGHFFTKYTYLEVDTRQARREGRKWGKFPRAPVDLSRLAVDNSPSQSITA